MKKKIIEKMHNSTNMCCYNISNLLSQLPKPHTNQINPEARTPSLKHLKLPIAQLNSSLSLLFSAFVSHSSLARGAYYDGSFIVRQKCHSRTALPPFSPACAIPEVTGTSVMCRGKKNKIKQT
uniref:(northern house mosquito) hypothetical protein n=1 Tax=Culex pipiens TaxID=7175 RepID=A0A8D8CIQ9_CULPI